MSGEYKVVWGGLDTRGLLEEGFTDGSFIILLWHCLYIQGD